MKLIYLPLEAYEERYTSQLCQWNTDRFAEQGIEYILVTGADLREDDAINVGQVLDAHGRSYYSLHQMANLVALLHDGDFSNDDVIFFRRPFSARFRCIAIYSRTIATKKPTKGFHPLFSTEY